MFDFKNQMDIRPSIVSLGCARHKPPSSNWNLKYNTFKKFLKIFIYFHLALKHVIDGFNWRNSSSPALEVQSILNLCKLFTIPRLHLEENPLSFPFLPARRPPLPQTPSVDVLAVGIEAAERSLRELGGGEGFGWAVERRPAPAGERLCEARRKRWDPRGPRSASARVTREPGRLSGPYAHTLCPL